MHGGRPFLGLRIPTPLPHLRRATSPILVVEQAHHRPPLGGFGGDTNDVPAGSAGAGGCEEHAAAALDSWALWATVSVLVLVDILAFLRQVRQPHGHTQPGEERTPFSVNSDCSASVPRARL